MLKDLEICPYYSRNANFRLYLLLVPSFVQCDGGRHGDGLIWVEGGECKPVVEVVLLQILYMCRRERHPVKMLLRVWTFKKVE